MLTPKTNLKEYDNTGKGAQRKMTIEEDNLQEEGLTGRRHHRNLSSQEDENCTKTSLQEESLTNQS